MTCGRVIVCVCWGVSGVGCRVSGVGCRGTNSLWKTRSRDAHAGTIVSYDCRPGFGGMFCYPCPPGTYKSSFGNKQCSACSNKPTMAVYVGFASTNAACPYVCKQGYEKPKCDSPFQAFINALGGVFGFVACAAGVLSLTCGAALAVHWRRKRQTDHMSVASWAFGCAMKVSAAATLLPHLTMRFCVLAGHQGKGSAESTGVCTEVCARVFVMLLLLLLLLLLVCG